MNFYDQVCGSKMPRAARGCLRCVVGDGTGFVVVGYSFPSAVLDIPSSDNLGAKWLMDGVGVLGEALVRQDRLCTSPRSFGEGVDAACFECGSGGGGESEWGGVDDVGVSREG